MGRAGHVVAQGNRAEGAEEHGTGVADAAEHFFGIGTGDVEVFGGEQVGKIGCFIAAGDHDECAERFEGLAGEVAALSGGELFLEFGRHGVERGIVPRNEDTGARCMFGLGNEIGGRVIWPSGFVGEDDDFAGAGDGVDIDIAVDEFFGEGDELVAGADDFIHTLHGAVDEAIETIGECGDGLSAAHAIDLGDAEFVADGEDIGVVRAISGWRRDDDDLFDAGCLSGDGRHEDSGGVGGGTAGHADADAIEWNVALAKEAVVRRLDFDVLMNDGGLEAENVIANAADGVEKLGGGAAVCGGELLAGDTERVGGELGVVELGRVTKNGIEALGADVGADAFDNFGGGHGGAEDFQRFLAAGVADDVATGSELGSQLGDGGLGVGQASVDALDF